MLQMNLTNLNGHFNYLINYNPLGNLNSER